MRFKSPAGALPGSSGVPLPSLGLALTRAKLRIDHRRHQFGVGQVRQLLRRYSITGARMGNALALAVAQLFEQVQGDPARLQPVAVIRHPLPLQFGRSLKAWNRSA